MTDLETENHFGKTTFIDDVYLLEKLRKERNFSLLEEPYLLRTHISSFVSFLRDNRCPFVLRTLYHFLDTDYRLTDLLVSMIRKIIPKDRLFWQLVQNSIFTKERT